MDFEQGSKRDRHNESNPQGHPQPAHRVNLTLAVVDPQALWAAAAARLLCAPDMTLDDVLDVIGPREDPSIASCIAMMVKPVAIPGCVMDDFWVDSLRDCPPRIDISGAVLEYKLTSANKARRRAPAAPRAVARPTLSLIPQTYDEAPTS